MDWGTVNTAGWTESEQSFSTNSRLQLIFSSVVLFPYFRKWITHIIWWNISQHKTTWWGVNSSSIHCAVKLCRYISTFRAQALPQIIFVKLLASQLSKSYSKSRSCLLALILKYLQTVDILTYLNELPVRTMRHWTADDAIVEGTGLYLPWHWLDSSARSTSVLQHLTSFKKCHPNTLHATFGADPPQCLLHTNQTALILCGPQMMHVFSCVSSSWAVWTCGHIRCWLRWETDHSKWKRQLQMSTWAAVTVGRSAPQNIWSDVSAEMG